LPLNSDVAFYNWLKILPPTIVKKSIHVTILPLD